jgi:hypothetical protein
VGVQLIEWSVEVEALKRGLRIRCSKVDSTLNLVSYLSDTHNHTSQCLY